MLDVWNITHAPCCSLISKKVPLTGRELQRVCVLLELMQAALSLTGREMQCLHCLLIIPLTGRELQRVCGLLELMQAALKGRTPKQLEAGIGGDHRAGGARPLRQA